MAWKDVLMGFVTYTVHKGANNNFLNLEYIAVDNPRQGDGSILMELFKNRTEKERYCEIYVRG